MPYVAVPGCDPYYEGAGEGAPLVCIHGGFAGLDTVLRGLKPFD